MYTEETSIGRISVRKEERRCNGIRRVFPRNPPEFVGVVSSIPLPQGVLSRSVILRRIFFGPSAVGVFLPVEVLLNLNYATGPSLMLIPSHSGSFQYNTESQSRCFIIV